MHVINAENGSDLHQRPAVSFGLGTAALAGMTVSPGAIAVGLASVFDDGGRSFTGWTTCTARGVGDD